MPYYLYYMFSALAEVFMCCIKPLADFICVAQ